jgi:hypothetical protein
MIPRIIPPGTGVTLRGLLLIDGDEDAERDGEGVGSCVLKKASKVPKALRD